MRAISRPVATVFSVALLCSVAHAQSKSAFNVGVEQLKSQLQNIRQGFPGQNWENRRHILASYGVVFCHLSLYALMMPQGLNSA
jgi:type IV secretory pathway VirB2 component (pilin)